MTILNSYLQQVSLKCVSNLRPSEYALCKRVRFSSLILVFLLGSKRPPPDLVPPVCYNLPCNTRRIHTKIYIDDDLWKKMEVLWNDVQSNNSAVARKMREKWGNNPTRLIISRLKITFREINKLLIKLDNGGFKLVFGADDVVKLGDSDVKLGETYRDRLENNETKHLNIHEIYSHTLAFQQGVEKLSDRNSRDLRILVRNYNMLDKNVKSIGEELCVCNSTTFGCVVVFSIEVPTNWAVHKSHFAHVIAHSIGAPRTHDDDFYLGNPDEKLIMWKNTGNLATLWSPEAKHGINAHDNSCLKVETTEIKSKNDMIKEKLVQLFSQAFINVLGHFQ